MKTALELQRAAIELQQELEIEYPWVIAQVEDAKNYIDLYQDDNVHLYYDYLLDTGIITEGDNIYNENF